MDSPNLVNENGSFWAITYFSCDEYPSGSDTIYRTEEEAINAIIHAAFGKLYKNKDGVLWYQDESEEPIPYEKLVEEISNNWGLNILDHTEEPDNGRGFLLSEVKIKSGPTLKIEDTIVNHYLCECCEYTFDSNDISGERVLCQNCVEYCSYCDTEEDIQQGRAYRFRLDEGRYCRKCNLWFCRQDDHYQLHLEEGCQTKPKMVVQEFGYNIQNLNGTEEDEISNRSE